MAQTVKRPKTPWRDNEELKRFWALARRYGGDDFVYDTIYLRYGAEKLHEIARHQFIDLMMHMQTGGRQAGGRGQGPGVGDQGPGDRGRGSGARGQEAELSVSGCSCDAHHGAASCGQYRKILWLMRHLGWDEIRLNAYIKKYAHIDSIRFFTAAKARGIISGMEKMFTKLPAEARGRIETTSR